MALSNLSNILAHGQRGYAVGSIVFVHGTGVRLADFKESLGKASGAAKAAGIDRKIVPCAWGDSHGILFEGFSLPDPPDEATLAAEAQEEARWTILFEDPLFELNALAIRGKHAAPPLLPPGVKPGWLTAWDKIAAYVPGPELRALLERAGLDDDWAPAWAALVADGLPRRAVEAAAADGELADAFIALARAQVATMCLRAMDGGQVLPARKLRVAMQKRLVEDWGQNVFGLKTFVSNLFLRAATRVARRRRNKFNAVVSLPIGDILLYQARGAEIRDFIRGKVLEAAKKDPPVALVAHSLGGVAAFDLMAMADAPPVSHLVTYGSQAPFFYEIGALPSLGPPDKPDQPGPGFPPWLNIYDRDDFLSFVGERLFPGRVVDHEVQSGQPFPHSHGAYAASEDVWTRIAEFLET
jgi:hypothetical protein